jgi:hypothetical protein
LSQTARNDENPAVYRCLQEDGRAVFNIAGPIKTQHDYRPVLKEINGLMMGKRNTPEGDRLDVLVTLVEAWERKHYPLDLPDPVAAIKYHMDQNTAAKSGIGGVVVKIIFEGPFECTQNTSSALWRILGNRPGMPNWRRNVDVCR